MIIDLKEQNNIICRKLQPYLKSTAYFVLTIDHTTMIIYLDSISYYGTVKLRTAYIPFYLDEYKINLI